MYLLAASFVPPENAKRFLSLAEVFACLPVALLDTSSKRTQPFSGPRALPPLVPAAPGRSRPGNVGLLIIRAGFAGRGNVLRSGFLHELLGAVRPDESSQ